MGRAGTTAPPTRSAVPCPGSEPLTVDPVTPCAFAGLAGSEEVLALIDWDDEYLLVIEENRGVTEEIFLEGDAVAVVVDRVR